MHKIILGPSPGPVVKATIRWAKEVEDDLYEISQVFARAWLYDLLVRAGSRGVRFCDLPHTAVQAVNEAPARDRIEGN